MNTYPIFIDHFDVFFCKVFVQFFVCISLVLFVFADL